MGRGAPSAPAWIALLAFSSLSSFFFHAEDGIRDGTVTGVQTCALPISLKQKNNTALVFIHGGGWAYGSPSEFFGACRRYAKAGVITFSIQYRLSKDAKGNVPVRSEERRVGKERRCRRARDG